MLIKTLANYGGPFLDAFVAENPETDLSASEGNRAFEDTAQMTHTAVRAEVSFTTTVVAAPTTVVPTTNTVWGSGAGQLPTVAKTATGRYTVTYATTFADALGVNETVSFVRPMVHAWGANAADRLYARAITVASNVVTLVTQSPEGTDANVGNVSGNPFQVELWLR